MSTPFTIDGTNWQEKAEELRLAFSERRRHRVLGLNMRYAYQEDTKRWEWDENGDGTENDVLPAGANIQTINFWAFMQTQLMGYQIYVTVFPADTETWTLAIDEPVRSPGSWLHACQLLGGSFYTDDTDYGWPRAAELDEDGNPVMTRGVMQAGDIIGEWIITSLVEMMSTMKYINHSIKKTEIASWSIIASVYWPSGIITDYEAAYARLLTILNDEDPPEFAHFGLSSTGYVMYYTRQQDGPSHWFERALGFNQEDSFEAFWYFGEPVTLPLATAWWLARTDDKIFDDSPPYGRAAYIYQLKALDDVVTVELDTYTLPAEDEYIQDMHTYSSVIECNFTNSNR